MGSLSALNQYFKRYYLWFVGGILCVILSNVFAIYVPVFVRMGIDDAVILSDSVPILNSSLIFKWVTWNAVGFGLAIVIVAILKGLFLFLMRQLLIVTSRKIEYDQKNELFKKYLNLGESFYRKNYTGDLMSRITEDVSNVRMYIGPSIMYFTNIIFSFLLILSQMFMINPRLTFWVMLPLPLLSYSIYQVSKKINLGNKKIQEQLSLLTTKAQETFAGIRVIKSFGAEHSFSDDFHKAGIEYQKRTLSLARINALFFPLMALLMGLSTIIILYVGGKEVEANRFTAGNVAEFIIYLNMLIWPVASLGWTTALVQKAAASQTRINEFLNQTEVLDQGNKLSHWENEIQLMNISHRFQEKPFNALSGINLTIKKGQFIGVVGKTGSGKSTLLQLLSRQIEIQEGRITLDNMDYKDFSITSFRDQLAYVPQDVFLFSDTIRQNILLGAQDIHRVDTKEDFSVNSRLSHALRISCLEKDLQNFPMGLETVIGERGVSLSGGQKQRLAIARALMRDASILLLDDCLSAVDADTEAEIIANLHGAFKDQNLTVIMSSHRLAPIMKADQILVLNQGELQGIGNHNLLITENDFYKWLYHNQTVEN